MQGEWKESSFDLEKMNLNSDYIVYTNKKEKNQLLSKKLFQCYSEICKVKHLLQCVTEENAHNKRAINHGLEEIHITMRPANNIS